MTLDDPRKEYTSRPPRPVKRHPNGQIVGLEDVRIDEESDVHKAILAAYEIIAPVVPDATALARSAVLGTTWARRMIFWLEGEVTSGQLRGHESAVLPSAHEQAPPPGQEERERREGRDAPDGS